MDADRKNIISAINTPLGFFALSLLIVEGFLGIVLIFSQSLEKPYFWGMLIGAFLFLLVVSLVWLLVWNKPTHLTLEGKDYRALAMQQQRLREQELRSIS